MRASLTLSEIEKNIYPKCNLKKQHQKESANLICLTPTCKLKGPICALCKKQHNGHNVIPFKTFINNIQKLFLKNNLKIISEGQQKIQQIGAEQKSLKNIQQGFLEVMGMLKLQVLQISDHIRNTQQRLIKQFQQIKIIHLKQTYKNQQIEQTLEYFKQKQITDIFQFRKNITILIKSVNCSKNEIFIDSEIDQIINSYRAKVQIYKDNIYNMQNELKHMFQLIHQKASIQKIKMTRPKTAFPLTGPGVSKNFCFSSSLKSSNILLEKDGAISKMKDNSGDKFVFLNNCISAKNNQIMIKILDLKGIICLGIGLKDKIKQKAFKFQKNVFGHGAYLISSNYVKYNHSEKSENNINNQFNFVTGDVIHISLDFKGKILCFKCKNDQKKVSQLNLKSLGDNLWKQLQFCIVFSCAGDKVQII